MWSPSLVLDPIAESFGLAPDVLKVLISFTFSIPLGYVHGKLPTEQSRHLFNIAIGLIMGFIVLDWSILHSVFTVMVSWGLMQFAPRKTQHKLVTGFVFGYLTISHMYRMYVDYMGYTMDFTAAQMVITLKASMTAMNLFDGSLPTSHFKDADQQEMLRDRILHPPALMDYLSYMFHFGTFHTGPVITFNHFRIFSKRLASQRNELEDGIRRAALFKFLSVFWWAAIHSIGIWMPYKFTTTDAFSAWAALPVRVVYLWISVTVYRFRYYAVWTLAEVSCITSGLGANTLQPADGADLDAGRFTSTISPAAPSTAAKGIVTRAIEAVAVAAGAPPPLGSKAQPAPAGKCSPAGEAAALVGKIIRPIYDAYYGPHSSGRGKLGVSHDACTNVDVWGVELPDNVKMVTDSWNLSVGRYLRVYVYGRLMPRDGRKAPAMLVNITQLVSAFWHGFYPGYYMMFGIMSGITQLARHMRTLVRPIVLRVSADMPQVKLLYDVAGAVTTAILLNSSGVAFLLLDARIAFSAWLNISLLPVIVSLLGPPLIQQCAPFLKKLAAHQSATLSPKDKDGKPKAKVE